MAEKDENFIEEPVSGLNDNPDDSQVAADLQFINDAYLAKAAYTVQEIIDFTKYLQTEIRAIKAKYPVSG